MPERLEPPMIEAIISWFLQYSSILEFISSMILTAVVIILSWKQYKLSEKTVLRPNWEVCEISLLGEEKKCSGTILLENKGGIGKDISLTWITCNGDYNGDRIPKVESRRNPDTILRKSAHPGDTIEIPVEFENLDKMNRIMINISSEEISDIVTIEPQKLIASIN